MDLKGLDAEDSVPEDSVPEDSVPEDSVPEDSPCSMLRYGPSIILVSKVRLPHAGYLRSPRTTVY